MEGKSLWEECCGGKEFVGGVCGKMSKTCRWRICEKGRKEEEGGKSCEGGGK